MPHERPCGLKMGPSLTAYPIAARTERATAPRMEGLSQRALARKVRGFTSDGGRGVEVPIPAAMLDHDVIVEVGGTAPVKQRLTAHAMLDAADQHPQTPEVGATDAETTPTLF
ncbi:tRNA(Arg) A34 adenosine deaminase TadA [Streptosporangium album]|uniref:tRNA(Arg) A34 adenosine deaminase TadA n=1 Tax=Streptosporangium album TaxID=47479 RepID=A0A7W7W7A0_9ACTN|nr:hypothetical protein [Streptosporangium album]MBB4936571.1 tRNA(Arg) A34 adenosine deaminase TadA [Streptosporangium album]